MHCCYFIAFMLTFFRLTKGCVTFFDSKQLLWVFCILWCKFVKYSSTMYVKWWFFFKVLLRIFHNSLLNKFCSRRNALLVFYHGKIRIFFFSIPNRKFFLRNNYLYESCDSWEIKQPILENSDHFYTDLIFVSINRT